ncbi:MAG: substrate-binding domain-containing protein [Arcobacteraceae bacterium]
MHFIKILILLFITNIMLAKDIKTKVIAFAQDDMSNDFRKAQVLEAKEEVTKYKNIKFIYSDAKAQTSLLIANIDKYIESDVDAIIVGTNDENALNIVLEKAAKKNVKVIILDRGVSTDKYTTFINSDNIEIGQIGAQYIAKKLKNKGLILLFEGLQSADVTKLRTRGFMDEISQHKNIKVIKRTGNYLRRDAIIEMEKLIGSGIKVDAVFGESDSMISGVRSVLLKHNIDPSTIVTVGCDYTSEAQEAIRKGLQTGSVLFPLGGTQSVQTAVKLFNNEEVAKHIVIPVKLVTKDNVEMVNPIF